MTPANWIQSGLPPSIEYLARAEMFRKATYSLVDMTDSRVNWPKYFLLGHAVELALKAVTRSFEERTGREPVKPMPARHDLLGYYEAAIAAGMKRLPSLIEGALQELAALHEDHFARYPKERRPVMLATYFDAPTDQVLQLAGEVVRSPR